MTLEELKKMILDLPDDSKILMRIPKSGFPAGSFAIDVPIDFAEITCLIDPREADPVIGTIVFGSDP